MQTGQIALITNISKKVILRQKSSPKVATPKTTFFHPFKEAIRINI